jgi:hypothetical protein
VIFEILLAGNHCKEAGYESGVDVSICAGAKGGSRAHKEGLLYRGATLRPSGGTLFPAIPMTTMRVLF